MIEGKTASGFAFTVPENVGSDWRLVDAIDDAQSEDRMAQLRGIRAICKIMLGPDGYERLKNHLAEKSGYINMKRMEAEILEVFAAVKAVAGKN